MTPTWLVTLQAIYNERGDRVVQEKRFSSATHGVLINHSSGVLHITDKTQKDSDGEHMVIAAFKHWERVELV